MKISIVVPTCTAPHNDVTFSPKEETFRTYYREDDYSGQSTTSTSISSASEDFSHISDDTAESYPPVVLNPPRHIPVSRRSPVSSKPVSSDDIYKSLVVGPASNARNNTPSPFQRMVPRVDNDDEVERSNRGISSLASIENHMPQELHISSPDDIYKKLVVGSSSPTHTPAHQHNVTQSASFQSVGSNQSRQIVYQAANTNWSPDASLPPNIVEEEEEDEPENEILAMIENGEMYRAWVVAPLLMAAAAMSARKEEAAPMKKAKDSITLLKGKSSKKSNSLKGILCAAEEIEEDLFGMIDSVRVQLLGGGNDMGLDVEAEEEDVSLTRLSADLRKQRLRNHVLQSERDTVNEENNTLRDDVHHKQGTVDKLQERIQELEEAKQKAQDETVSRDVKLGSMMNEFLENPAINGSAPG